MNELIERVDIIVKIKVMEMHARWQGVLLLQADWWHYGGRWYCGDAENFLTPSNKFNIETSVTMLGNGDEHWRIL